MTGTPGTQDGTGQMALVTSKAVREQPSQGLSINLSLKLITIRKLRT